MAYLQKRARCSGAGGAGEASSAGEGAESIEDECREVSHVSIQLL